MTIPVVLAWSGGKDSALALAELDRDDRYEVVALLTTLTRQRNRVTMHGVRRELIRQQAESLGMRLIESWIDAGADNAAYERSLSEALQPQRDSGVSTVAFGDLFLEEIREFRDAMFARCGMTTLYPLWGAETLMLAHQFILQGYEAVTCCIDSDRVPVAFCGQPFNTTFLQTLPSSVDPCGENGEFHTLVYNSPQMSWPIALQLGEKHREGRFYFQDLQRAARHPAASGETT